MSKPVSESDGSKQRSQTTLCSPELLEPLITFLHTEGGEGEGPASNTKTPEGWLPLTQLVLGQEIARGGMGTVWRAVHRTQRCPVAVKFVLGKWSDSTKLQFEQEVAAVARLQHPGVIRLADVGHVQLGDDPELEVGSGYLVMEWAAGGSLENRPPRNWAEAEFIIEQLLDALSHAHSHGLIHRDIKFGNILLCSTLEAPDLTPTGILDSRPVLSDFGITITNQQTGLIHAGTPDYMAPEQIRRQPHLFGPWTDIYQVGVMLWAIVSNQFPFTGTTTKELFRAHLTQDLGPLTPRFLVPKGVENWLQVCLAKDISQRFASAAEAREALLELQTTPCTLRDRGLPRRQLPWQRRSMPEPSSMPPLHLEGMGLGLLRYLHPPIFGRQAQQRSLWRLLQDTNHQQAAQAAVLTGPKEHRLVEMLQWVRQTVTRTGMGCCFEVQWNPQEPVRGLINLLHQLTLSTGLTGKKLASVVTRNLAPFNREILTHRVIHALGHKGYSYERTSQICARLLELWSKDQLVVVLFVTGVDARCVDFMTAFVSNTHRELRVAMIAALEEPYGTSEVKALKDLTTHSAEVLPLGPLSRKSQLKLLRSVAKLQPSVEDQLLDTSRGLESLMLQQLTSLWQDNQLKSSAHGFVARTTLVIQPMNSRRWEEALEQLVVTKEHRTALMVAGALGQTFNRNLWLSTTAQLGAQVAPVQYALNRKGLLRTSTVDKSQLVFAHPALVQALKQLYPATTEVYSIIADTAKEQGHQPTVRVQYLEAANRHSEAFELLITMFKHYNDAGDRIELDRCVAALQRGISHLNPTKDRLWNYYHIQVKKAIYDANLENSETWIALLEEATNESQSEERQVQYLLLQGRVQRLQRKNATEILTQAHQRAAGTSSNTQTLTALELSYALRDCGQISESIELLLNTLNIPMKPVDHASLQLTLARVYLMGHRHQAALDLLVPCEQVFRDHHLSVWEATACNARGDCSRQLGLFDDAAQAYHRAFEILEEIDGHIGIAVVNLAMIDLRRQQPHVAYRRVYRMLGSRINDDPQELRLFVHSVLLAATAHLPPKKHEFYQHLEYIKEAFKGPIPDDGDLSLCLAYAASGAQSFHAREAFRLQQLATACDPAAERSSASQSPSPSA